MLTASNITLGFGERVLFKDVNIKFTPGNCYGLIGANGSGKSTFLKILSGDTEQDSGDVIITPGERLAVLRQDHFAFDDSTVMNTVIMGHKALYDIMIERDEIYAKPDFSEEDGIKAAELEADFTDMNGWEAESEAATLLSGLGIGDKYHDRLMKDLEGGEKVRILLAQALFGNPDILLLDEPTNHLDIESIQWLEEFLYRFKNTVIVVSHDRHFLNKVCTHIADIDFQKIQLFVGNYDFWYESNQLIRKQLKDQKKRSEDKAAELKAFIQRFAANASKSKQATARKKELEKLNLDEIKPSSRRFPYINFKSERECGKIVLDVQGINKTIDGEQVLKNFNLTIEQGDKVAFLSPGSQAKSALFDIIAGVTEPDSGSISWGVTISSSYFPKDNAEFFSSDINLVDWLRQYTTADADESYVRGFLGRMLFSGEEALKKVSVLSGGEKVRCMLSRMMLAGSNVLIMDEPTNHLDLESITALNNGLIDFSEVILFASHDHQFIDTIANRIIEITPSGGMIDRRMRFDEYINDPKVQEVRDEHYHGHDRLVL